MRFRASPDGGATVEPPVNLAGLANDPANKRDPSGRDTRWSWEGNVLQLETTILAAPIRENLNATA